MGYIYCFTNLINNKKYIGSTIQEVNIRYNQHVYNAFHENAYQYHYPLYEAIRKYGLNNFNFEILHHDDSCDEETLRQIEQQYIIYYNSLSPNGYNQTLDTAHPINDIKSYQKVSQTKRDQAKCVAEIDENNNIIQIWNSIVDCAEALQISERHIADCCRGERHSTQGKRFCWLDDNNQLLIPSYTGFKYQGAQGTTQKQKTNRKVAQIDKITLQILNTYDSIALAARETGCDESGISKVCRGKRKTCNNYIWQYIDE